MGKRIWIVNPQTGSPDKAANPRYLEFAKFFMAAGYEVITFNSSQREGIVVPNGKYQEKQYGEYRFVHIYTPEFVGNGVKRMRALFKYAQTLYSNRNIFEKPDVILHNIHPPFDYPVVYMAKRLKVKYIAEAWDLWPESFVRFGLTRESSPLMKMAHAIEKRYYYSADEIVFTLKGAIDYLRMNRWTKDEGGKIDTNHIHYINNGIDLESFDINSKKYPRPDEDINDPNILKIIYLGSINKANNVKTLVEAAALLKDHPKYRFFIYGNGAYRQELMSFVKEKQIDNVVFKEERISFKECAWVVSQATVNVMNYEKGFGKWGVSSGKMFQYLAAGKPIVCNRDIQYDNVIKEEDLGVSRELITPEAFAQAIRDLAEQPRADYDGMCERVRKAAQRYDYKRLAHEEIKVIESALAQ
ncbi:MAG: glycosyltransferase family 4 protein [Bacteroidales bacterium]|nr:glycosyltransferase family 4 protein [Bacteroidales bacterium]